MDNSSKKINNLARSYEGYVSELRKFTRLYYPNILGDIGDSSVGSWMIDLNASVSDNLSNYIDRAYSETTIDQATTRRALFAIARSKGLKIPGKKCSLVEVEISCELPMINQSPDEDYYPIIRKGSTAVGGGASFELLYDVNFAHQFDHNGISNRIIIPKRDSNGTLTGYTVKKREIMSASSTKLYKIIINENMLVPFMEIILPELNVLSVDSIICKEGTNFTHNPTMPEFSIYDENLSVDGVNIWKYFEVDSLLEDKLFLPQTIVPVGKTFPEMVVVTEQIEDILNNRTTLVNNTSVVRGMWKPIKQKFVTEYTDRGYFKVIFGPGSTYNIPLNPTPSQKLMCKMINNTNMGVLPQPGQTMWIQYRIGGGALSNIANGTINSFSYKDVEIKGKNGGATTIDANNINSVNKSLRITNTSSAMGGRDEPSIEEIRYMIKYNNMAQNRCVTIKDYIDRIGKMPGLYGTPFRTSIVEKNNIIFIYVLGIDSKGHATDMVTTALMDNMSNYLSEYKMINDYVIIKPGRVINIQVDCDIIINKGYNNNSVVRSVQDAIYDFFDINNHNMGDNIFISKLIKDLVLIPGVENLIEVRIFNVYGGVYNTYSINQPVITGTTDEDGNWTPVIESSNRVQVDLVASDNILYGNSDAMFEILSKDTDVKIRIKQI